ncbi:hypothetical protein F4859DRAFT_114323 [Xylaria cf. heliscus]|nr:hypothetical protein F4859DRAFT_114323 [Xylaria cf. heliscus]
MATVTISSRRFACDRCRGQKLRCLREKLDPDRCDRCLRADAECLTTPHSTVRNHPTHPLSSTTHTHPLSSTTHTHTHSRKRKHSGQYSAPSTTYAGVDPLVGMVALHSAADSADADLAHAWEDSVHNLPVEFGSGLDMDSIILSSLDCASANDCATASPYGLPSQYTSQFNPTPEETPGRETPNQEPCRKGSKGSRETMGMGLALDGFLGSQSISNQSSPPASYSPETCLHRLSRTNLSLISQLGRVDRGSPDVTLDMLITRSDESDPSTTSPVEDILRCTREFIEALEAISRKPGPSTPLPQSAAASARSESSSSTGPENLEGSRSVDVTILLLALSCYVQVLRLYVVLFAHIHQFLQEIANSEDPTLCPLPDMGFGNFVVGTLFIPTVYPLRCTFY